MGTQTFTFFGGIIVGIYLDQNYQIPNLDKILKKSLEYLKKLEK